MRLSRLLPLPALLGLFALATSAPSLAGCDSNSGDCETTTPFSFENISPEGTVLGEAVALGDCITIDYVGRRAVDDSVFAQASNRSFLFPDGLGAVNGFLLGMSAQRVGETRLVVVPPTSVLGYGNYENPPLAEGLVGIPACSTVEFEIRLRAINQDPRTPGC